MNIIDNIWRPKTQTQTILIDIRKVMPGENVIIFKEDINRKNKKYHINSNDIITCPITNNGKIPCYEVPISSFEEEIC